MFSIRAPSKLLAELKEVAKESGHSVTNVTVQFLRFALDAYRKERK